MGSRVGLVVYYGEIVYAVGLAPEQQCLCYVNDSKKYVCSNCDVQRITSSYEESRGKKVVVTYCLTQI